MWMTAGLPGRIAQYAPALLAIVAAWWRCGRVVAVYNGHVWVYRMTPWWLCGIACARESTGAGSGPGH